MKIKQLSTETSYVNDAVAPSLSILDLEVLRKKYLLSPRKRHRFCFHQNPSVNLHDIVICYDSTSYIPPNKHIGKVESLLVLCGTLDFYLFNDSGKVYDYRRLSAPGEGLPFYIRVPPNTWHGLRAVGSTPCIIKETISGPYDPSTLEWADFAPSESHGVEAGFRWYDQIDAERVRLGIVPPKEEAFQSVNDTVFRSCRQLVTVSLEQLEPIKHAARSSTLKRARLCCHGGPEEKLQEMFIALAGGVDIEESMHIRKDESLTVIQGSGRYIFPNEDGTERAAHPLAAFDGNIEGGEKFFVRINRFVPHKILVDSDVMLIYEATSGPFSKEDTSYRIPGVS